MDPFLLKLFHKQVWLQCKFAIAAYGDLHAALLDREPRGVPVPSPDWQSLGYPADAEAEEIWHRYMAESSGYYAEPATRIWGPVQGLLTAAANISKVLWGQGGKSAARREPIRTALSVDDTSPLQPTSMRNNFDHFDERLEDWFQRSPQHNYVDLSLGDPAQQIVGIPADEMFRSYDPATGDLIFWGARYNLLALMDEIERILPLALAGS